MRLAELCSRSIQDRSPTRDYIAIQRPDIRAQDPFLAVITQLLFLDADAQPEHQPFIGERLYQTVHISQFYYTLIVRIEVFIENVVTVTILGDRHLHLCPGERHSELHIRDAAGELLGLESSMK
jgi:hypothetical protein